MRRKSRRLFRRLFRCPRWQRRRSKSLPATPVAKSSSKLPTNQRADDSPNRQEFLAAFGVFTRPLCRPFVSILSSDPFVSPEVYNLNWLRVAEVAGAQFVVIFQAAVR